jgi:hypothetical protein
LAQNSSLFNVPQIAILEELAVMPVNCLKDAMDDGI